MNGIRTSGEVRYGEGRSCFRVCKGWEGEFGGELGSLGTRIHAFNRRRTQMRSVLGADGFLRGGRLFCGRLGGEKLLSRLKKGTRDFVDERC
jgi:hypothetical protein